MNGRSILLVYATRYGSTQEVAEVIAVALREAGYTTELHPMREVTSLDGFEAVVLGAAIYNARLHPDVHRFLSQHQETLQQLPVAIFVLGPLSTVEAAMQRSRHQLDRELEKYPWLKPVALEMFAGKIDPAKMNMIEKLIYTAKDNMDWEAIRIWANALSAHLIHDEVVRPV